MFGGPVGPARRGCRKHTTSGGSPPAARSGAPSRGLSGHRAATAPGVRVRRGVGRGGRAEGSERPLRAAVPRGRRHRRRSGAASPRTGPRRASAARRGGADRGSTAPAVGWVPKPADAGLPPLASAPLSWKLRSAVNEMSSPGLSTDRSPAPGRGTLVNRPRRPRTARRSPTEAAPRGRRWCACFPTMSGLEIRVAPLGSGPAAAPAVVCRSRMRYPEDRASRRPSPASGGRMPRTLDRRHPTIWRGSRIRRQSPGPRRPPSGGGRP